MFMRISFAITRKSTIAVASSTRSKGRGETRYHGADAGVAGKEAVIAILTFARVAEVAALLPEQNGIAMAEIPAARMLGEIATHGGDVTNLR